MQMTLLVQLEKMAKLPSNEQGTSNHTPLIGQKCGVLVLLLHNRTLWVGLPASHTSYCVSYGVMNKLIQTALVLKSNYICAAGCVSFLSHYLMVRNTPPAFSRIFLGQFLPEDSWHLIHGSVVMINTISKSNFRRKGLFWFTIVRR